MSVPGESDYTPESMESRAERVIGAFYGALGAEFNILRDTPGLTDAQRRAMNNELATHLQEVMSRADQVLGEFVAIAEANAQKQEEPSSEVIYADFGQAGEPEPLPAPEPEPEPTPLVLLPLAVEKMENGLLTLNGAGFDFTPRERELFDLLPSLGSRFSCGDVLNTYFHDEGTTSARTQSFRRAAKALEQKLNIESEDTVLAARGKNSTSHYVVLKPIVVNGVLIEAHVEPEPEAGIAPAPENPAPIDPAEPEAEEDDAAAPQAEAELLGGDAADEDTTGAEEPLADDLELDLDDIEELGDEVEPEEIEPEEVIVRAVRRAPRRILRQTVTTQESEEMRAEVKSVFDDYLSPEELLPLQDVLQLARAPKSARPASEVKDNRSVLMAVWAILDSGKAVDYRTKALLPIRYGIYPDTFKRNFPRIRRDNQPIDLAEVMQAVPYGQGVTLEAASQILGLKPEAILESELGFVKKMSRYDDYKALAAIVPQLETQLIQQKIAASR